MKNVLWGIVLFFCANSVLHSAEWNGRQTPIIISGKEYAKQISKTKVTKGFFYHQMIIGGTENVDDRWIVHVMEIIPTEFTGTIETALANDTVSGVEKLSSMVFRHNAVAGINGGFFVENNNDGVKGEAAGISVIQGKLLSEHTKKRPAFLVYDKHDGMIEASISQYEQYLSLKNNYIALDVTGINRKPGFVRNCGIGSPAQHDKTCNPETEVIIYSDEFGEDAKDFCINGYQFLDEEKLFLNDNYKSVCISDALYNANWRNLFDLEFISRHKKILANRNIKYAVNGGPTLIRNYIKDEYYEEEGWDLSRTKELRGWVMGRHPRTGVGIKEDGTLYFITVEGRQPGISAGFSINEFAEFFMMFNVKNAMNLDGGGSSAMFLHSKLLTTPTDKNGERSIADGILIKR